MRTYDGLQHSTSMQVCTVRIQAAKKGIYVTSTVLPTGSVLHHCTRQAQKIRAVETWLCWSCATLNRGSETWLCSPSRS